MAHGLAGWVFDHLVPEGKVLLVGDDTVDEHPGDYQVIVQVTTGNIGVPVYLVQHVNPTETFVKAIRQGITSGDVEVQRSIGVGISA